MRLKYLVGLAFMAIPFLMGAQTLETMNKLDHKVAIITRGAAGIGKETVIA